MNDRSIAIIGAGIGGLSAGCYARMNGYRAICRREGRAFTAAAVQAQPARVAGAAGQSRLKLS